MRQIRQLIAQKGDFVSHYTLSQSDLIQDLSINFDKDTSRVGVFFNGGLNSTVLLYALLLEREKAGYEIEITALTVAKVAAEKFSHSLLQDLQKKFGPLNHQVNIDNEGSPFGRITSAIQKKLRSHEFDCIYTGLAATPPASRFFSEFGEAPIRPVASPHPTLKLPFLNLYKSHIVELSQILNIQDLVAMTHSCTELLSERCRFCFACDERAWSFRENGMRDPGRL